MIDYDPFNLKGQNGKYSPEEIKQRFASQIKPFSMAGPYLYFKNGRIYNVWEAFPYTRPPLSPRWIFSSVEWVFGD